MAQITPIFICGCDRSGTTMLGDMLGSCRGAAATPESQFLHELLLLLHQGAFHSPAEAAEWLREHFYFAAWELQKNQHELAALIQLGDPRATVEAIVLAYLRQQGDREESTKVWVDHTPDNMRYYPLLAHYFPDARFVHIVRDGRAVFNSIKKLRWGPNNAYMGTRFWSERLRQAMLVEIAEGDNCARVRYEAILSNPETTLQRLTVQLGLPFDPSIVMGGGLRLPGFTRQQHGLVGQRPKADRMHAWQAQMSPAEIAEFESYFWSRVYLQQLGYRLQSSECRKLSLPGVLWRYLHDGLMYGINRLRHRLMERTTLRRYLADKQPSS